MKLPLLRPFRAVWNAAFRQPALGGVLGGLVFWLAALAPTLMPRTPLSQGAAGGLCLAIGYGIGTFGGFVGHAVLKSRRIEVTERARAVCWRVVGFLGLAGGVGGSAIWLVSQKHQRAAMSMSAPATLDIIPMVLVSLVVAGLFVTGARGVRGFGRLLGRGVTKVVPDRVATPATVLVTILLVVFVAWPLLRGTFASWANDSFGLIDATTNEGTYRPMSPDVSGSPASLVRWDDLGRQGRDFVAGATPESVLAKVQGVDGLVHAPVRVYVGRESAGTNGARAALAVKELERTGAFDRKVLAVVTSTGSGWIDPDAAEALEAMYGGDTAIVSQQYSFLPSWIATLLEPHASGEAGSALFEAVHAKWAALPEMKRPKLLVFGLSLGSFGTEQEFAGPTAAASLANLTGRTDGVLLVGPTASNPIWRQLTEGRDASSPVWRPVVGGGAVVRFEGRSPTLGGIDATWKSPRVLYVQHPSDPVTFWDASWFWSKPASFDRPRGDAVTARTWFPIVTGVQGVFDLMAGFGAPPGFGHDYRLDYVRAWAQVAQPPGWSDTDTKALETQLHR